MYCFYINLDKRRDRRLQFENECVKMGIEVERFPAVAHSVPSYGCTLSHLNVLKLARERKYNRVCIFEDDFEFIISKQEFQDILKNIPSDFDVVMLSYYLFETQPYNNYFGKVISATTASAYIVNQKFYNTIINNLETGSQLFSQNIHDCYSISKYINDQYWKHIQPQANWLYSLKRVGKQRPSYSDLLGGYVSYSY
jgi:glycosyl transferase family 25